MSVLKKPSVATILGIIGILILIIISLWMIVYGDFEINGQTYTSAVSGSTDLTIIRGPKIVHVDTPEEVRAIYMTSCYGASPKLRNKLVHLIETTDLNAIVIDIKDYTGTISIPTKNTLLKEGHNGRGCTISDIKEFIQTLHNKDIYVIGRITVFQDPLYAKHHPELAVHRVSNKEAVWHDYKGLAFIDVGAHKYWDYIVSLAQEAYGEIGFDELNFDYIRYPSDGPMKDVYYTHSGGYAYNVKRAENLEKFFKYLHSKLKQPNAYGEVPTLSADLFGMTATNYDDLTIGQVLERTLPYFDAVAPMVYPSHYPKSFLGLGNPNKHVYKVVNYSMSKAVDRTTATSTKIASLAYDPINISSTSTEVSLYSKPKYSTSKMRPWLQDFDYGGNYDIAEVEAQIKASRDAGVTGGYMLWDPANRYTRGVHY